MYILVPTAITAAMLGAGTSIPEPDTARGEVAWVSGAAAALDAERTYLGSIYTAVQAMTGRTLTPDNDPTYWLLKGPTNRMAPFDYYKDTPAVATTSMTYKVNAGFMNAIAIYGMDGYQYAISVAATPGGTPLVTYSGYLFENAVGLYELLFTPLKQITKLVFTDLPISPTSELTITLTAATGAKVSMGMLNIGDLRSLFGFGNWGGTEYGAEAEPLSYSYINTDAAGKVSIKRRGKATNLRASVAMPTEFADGVLATIQEVLDVPVSVIGSNVPGYTGLNVFGLLSGSMRYETYSTARLSATVKGII